MRSERIEPLLRFREVREEERRREATEAERRLHAQDAHIQAIEGRIDDVASALRMQSLAGMDAAEIGLHEEHLAALRNQRRLALAARSEMARDRDVHLTRLVAAHRDRRLVENLHERAVVSERNEALRVERGIATELAVLSSIRRGDTETRSAS